jgi:ABC-type antimicrobial peptide transport system permease subunit
VVVTQALADRLWPGENPIGKGIGSNGEGSHVWYRVVGVVPEIRVEALDLKPTEAVFYAVTPLVPQPKDGGANDLAYFVRASVDPVSLIPQIRSVVAQYNARVPFMDARLMSTVVERSMARTSFIMTLLGIAALVALTLSVVGIYGVISYVVTQRRSEIGIRMALGASVTDVVRMVVMQSVRLAAAGVVVGLLGALWTTRSLQALLYNVSPTDPLVMSVVPVSLLIIAVIASAAPARRAARVDPVEAMRSD